MDQECKQCKKSFKALLKHIVKSKKCEDFYGDELEDLKQWDSWCIETKAQAKAQNVEQVFDAKYKASSASNKELFEQKQKFMYAVFAKTLLTDKGK